MDAAKIAAAGNFGRACGQRQHFLHEDHGGIRRPDGEQLRGVANKLKHSSYLQKPLMTPTEETRARAVTGAQVATYAAKGEAWVRMRSEYWAEQKNGAKAKSFKPWSKAIIHGAPDMWLCAGKEKRCKNKRECYMCQL